MVQTKTFTDETEMNTWLANNSKSIKVINISSNKRGWNMWTGMLGSGKNIWTVVYEKVA